MRGQSKTFAKARERRQKHGLYKYTLGRANWTRRMCSFERVLIVPKWLYTMNLAIEGAENVSLQQDKHW